MVPEECLHSPHDLRIHFLSMYYSKDSKSLPGELINYTVVSDTELPITFECPFKEGFRIVPDEWQGAPRLPS